MTDPLRILAARQYGEVRYAVVSESTGGLSRVLGKLGLTPDPARLVEHDRQTALTILQALLWKDMAYGIECMPASEAETIASDVFRQHSVPGSKYFSNRDGVRGDTWHPLTESTFDSGVIITGDDNTYVCLWFQDED